MTNALILDSIWPEDLNLVDVPFSQRTITVLSRQGFHQDPSLMTTVTEGDVLGWWNAGPVTIQDMRATGNEAVRRHHAEADKRHKIQADLAAVALEPWSRQIWHNDPRFAEYLPRSEATVRDIIISGRAIDRLDLWSRLQSLRAELERQASLSLPDAVSGYVEAISLQHGDRLDVLLAHTGLEGTDPITGGEGARRLGVSSQRVYQIVGQLKRHRDRASPAAGIWMPQVDIAIERGWPSHYTAAGIAATVVFFER